ENLADLLVEDLERGSNDLRRRIPELLQGLEDEGRLMRSSDGSYAIQTGEGLKWNSRFRQEQQALLANPARLGEIRAVTLQEKVRDVVNTRMPQGETKTPREIVFHFGNETPELGVSDSKVVVWVRDGWNSAEKTIKADAREAGDESSLIYVFLPRRHDTEVRDAIATYQAARQTLEFRASSQ